jgi:streptomycin 6-kinase
MPAPPIHAIPTIVEWASGLSTLRRRFDGGTGPLPVTLVDRAEALFAELIGSQGAGVILHGDLHHDNILSAEREPWLAIDSKGVIGEAEYEPGAFLRNRLLSQPDPAKTLARRVNHFAERLGFDRQRMIG